MAAVNPPAFLQNAGATHTAEITRMATNQAVAGRTFVNSLRVRGGVNYDLGGALLVQQAGAPNMSVDVLTGIAVVPGTQGSTQHAYTVLNSATQNVPIAASHASLDRIDLIVFRVQDTAYSGAVNQSIIEAVTGTPAGSPAVPATNANSLILAQILVPATSTSVINSRITDRRSFLTGAGGAMRCLSTARPASTEIKEGQRIYEIDTKLEYLWDGTIFRMIPAVWTTSVLGSPAASIVLSSIPSTIKTLHLAWTARGDTALSSTGVNMRINGVSTASYGHSFSQQSTNVASGANTSGQVGNMYAASGSPAGQYGSGNIWITGWNDPHTRLTYNFNYALIDPASGGSSGYGGGAVNFDGPYTSITLLPGAGNFVANTQVTLTALA